MSFSRRSVMIPLASGAGRHGRMAHVHADGTKPTNDAKLSPEIALLNDCKLYPAGAIALAAVRQLALKPSGLALIQRLGQPPKTAYLSVSNAPELYGLTPENSSSAQLGLALAMIMYQAQSQVQLVIATGELATKSSLSHARDGHPQDVPVQPVGLIEQKLETVRQLLDDYKGGPFSSSIPFFFPRYTGQGEETLAVHRAEFERVTAAYREQGISLKLHPVSSLQEALRVLGLRRVKPRIGDRVAIGAAAGIALAGMTAFAAERWIERPIGIEFAPIQLTTGEAAASPFPARQFPDGGVQQLSICFNANGLPIYTAGNWMVLRALIPNADSPGLNRYHFAVVIVSESEIKVFPPIAWGVTPGAPEASIRLPVRDVEETNKLIVLARRLWPFDTEALRTHLEGALKGKPPSERINAAVNALVKEAPGYLDYSFRH